MNNFKSRGRLYIAGFILNMLLACAAFGIFLVIDRGLLMMSYDFNAQEQVFGTFMNRAIKAGNVLFNWSIDIGSDFVSSFGFYGLGSPFFWLTLPFPAGGFPYLIGPVFILKYAVAGLTSCVWLRRYTRTDWAALLGSVLYAFSGYQAANIIFYHFHDAVAFFPLLLIGLDHLMETRKAAPFAAAVGINVLVNWNFFFAETLWLILYYIFRYDLAQALRDKALPLIRRHIPDIGRCFLGGILGVMTAGVIFVPSLWQMLGNPRANNHIPLKYWLIFDAGSYIRLLRGLVMPGEPMNYQLSMQELNWYSVEAYLPMMGILFTAVFLACCREFPWLRRLLAANAVFALIPILNNSFTFFNAEPYRRWFYMPVLLMILASVLAAERMAEESSWAVRLRTYGRRILAGMAAAVTCLTIFRWDTGQTHAINDPLWFFVYFGTAAAGILLTVWWGSSVCRRRRAGIILLAGCMLFGFLNLAGNLFLYRKKTTFATAQKMYNEMFVTTWQMPEDTIPYRYAMFDAYFNRQMAHCLTSDDSFISTVDNGIFEFYDAIGYRRYSRTMEGPDGTDQLLSVRYYVTAKKQEETSSMKLISSKNNGSRKIYVYEDLDALPIGFTYDTYMTRSEFRKLDKTLRPMAMLRTLVVRDEDVPKVEGVLRHYEDDGRKLNRDSMKQDMARRKEESSESFTHGTGGFSCTIETEGERYAFFSVPWSDRWSAEVNGEPAEILNINGLMGIRLGKGKSGIVFTYGRGVAIAGVVSSLLGILGIVSLLIYERHAGAHRG